MSRIEHIVDFEGCGGEYCYEQDTSCGNYGIRYDDAQQSQQDAVVQQTISELIRYGADVAVRDNRGCTVSEIFDAKNRSDMNVWLKTLIPPPASTADDSRALQHGSGIHLLNRCWYHLLHWRL